MKRLLVLLYVLLFLLLCVLGWGLFVIFTMDTQEEVPEAFEAYQEKQEQVYIQEPVLEEPEADPSVYLNFDAESLRLENPDFTQWLMIPETCISFPVVITDNNDYYLYRDFHKNYNVFGCLYFDKLSIPGAMNRVIYGHNMGINREEMFSSLVDFQEQAFAEEHLFAYLSSSSDEPAEVYELFAVVNLNLLDEDAMDYAIANFPAPQERSDFIVYLKNKSIFKTDFTPEGNTLILSTCNREFGGNNRLLICFGQAYS